jgi:cytochrome bd-type quinol oxidase subunit 2
MELIKKSFTRSYFFLNSFLLLFILGFPQIIYAQGINFTLDSKLKSGINGINSIEDFLVTILDAFVIIAIPILILFIIYAGFLYVTARGNVEQVQQATRALTYAIIGGVLVIGAAAISVVVKNVVDTFTA